jgi:hypothetical protein
MSDLKDYLRRVREVLQSARHVLSDADVAEVEHLIRHDEPAEGLRCLAWIIVEGNKRVPAATISGIRTLTAGIVDPSDLPSSLDLHIA